MSRKNHMLFPMASLKSVAENGPMVVDSARGVRFTSGGREYLDAFCGLMNVNAGYGRDELVETAAEILKRLSFTSNFFERTSNEALELADKLAEITPGPITRFFYSVGGSDAVDSAIKLVRHANYLAGKPEKTVIIARKDTYHGMTFGGASATGQAILREGIGPLLPDVVHVDYPDPAKPGSWYAEQLEAKIKEIGAERVAAFLGEPVALPSGVTLPPDDYWTAVQEVCRRNDVRLIVDEVVTGFGRVGAMFASEVWNIEPDLMTMSKGITSGYLPLGAVGISDELYETLHSSGTILPHGFTAGGTPVACGVAVRNIRLIEEEGLPENSRRMGEYLLRALEDLQGRHPAVTGVRARGLLGAIDVDGARIKGEDAKAGVNLTTWLRENGTIVRPYGNTLAFGLGLIAEESDIDELVEAFAKAVQALGA